MRIVDLLCVTGAATAMFTMIQMPKFLASGDTGAAAGMFFSGLVLTVFQLSIWAYNR